MQIQHLIYATSLSPKRKAEYVVLFHIDPLFR